MTATETSETGFIATMERLAIATTSPDGAVRATYSIREGTRVDLTGCRLDRYTEQSLATEITAAVSGVDAGYAKAMDTVTGPDEADVPPPRVRRRHRAFQAELAELDVRATSPRALVKVRLSGTEGTQIRIKPGVLGRIDVGTDGLESEVNSALASATNEFGRERIALHRKHFDAADRFGTKVGRA